MWGGGGGAGRSCVWLNDGILREMAGPLMLGVHACVWGVCVCVWGGGGCTCQVQTVSSAIALFTAATNPPSLSPPHTHTQSHTHFTGC